MRIATLPLLAAALTAAAPAAHADGYAWRGYRYDNAVRVEGVDWSGLYSGIHNGGVTGKTIFVRLSFEPCPAPVGQLGALCAPMNAYRAASVRDATAFAVDIDGWHVGPHVGYQKQFGNVVVGADIGFSIGGGEGEADCTGNGGVQGFTARCKTEYKYSYNLRGRIGYARGSWLFYAMGGVTQARTDNVATYTLDTGQGVVKMGEKQIANPLGYLFGAGLEYQDTRGMRWGLSYTHLVFQDTTLVFRDPIGGGSTNRFKNDPDVLGAALKIPLQQQATQAADPGPPAAQAPSVGRGPVAPRPVAQATPRPATPPATAPRAAAPAAAPAPARPRQPTPAAGAPLPAAVPAAPAAAPTPRPPVSATPPEPDEPTPTGRPRK